MGVFGRVKHMADVAAVKGGARIACPSTHSKVTDGQDHFPMDTVGRARNALARVAQYKAVPPWWSGSLASLVKHIKSSVKRWWPFIDVTE